MRITIATGPSFPVPAVRGGAMSKAWERLAQEFVRQGHEVTVVARSFSGQAERESIGKLHFLRTAGFSQSASTAWDLIRDFAYALNLLPRLPSADLLITNDFWLPVFASRLRKSSGRVMVCAARFPKGQYGLYRHAFRIVALSRAVASAICRQQPALASRVTVIPLPVDLDELAPRGADRPLARSLLYVGRVHPEKGVLMLVRAFGRIASAFPAWRLVIVGPINEADGGGGKVFEERLRACAAAAPVEFRAPEFDPARLACIYRGADLLCYPSLAEHGEAFGVVPLEAMAAGLPPIVSALECFQDFLSDGSNAWVFDHRSADPEAALAQTLAEAMRDDAGRSMRSAQGLRDARAFSVASVARRYIDEAQRLNA